MKTHKIGKYQKGIRSEFYASLIILLKGYKIIAKRYKCKRGEIDIIAFKSCQIIFIEVKSSMEADALSQLQFSRIANAAEFFLANNRQYNKFERRFDLIQIKNLLNFKHHKNIW
jgi:putative endonuclease